MSNNRPLLDVSDLSMRFGGLLAVNGVKLDVEKGEVISIIGPNGAGKTTIFNCLTGFYRPTGGTIRYRGEEIQGLPGHLIARKGIVRTFQHVRLFREMTVIENLLVAQHMSLTQAGLINPAALLNLPSWRRQQKQAVDLASSHVRSLLPWTISGGQGDPEPMIAWLASSNDTYKAMVDAVNIKVGGLLRLVRAVDGHPAAAPRPPCCSPVWPASSTSCR